MLDVVGGAHDPSGRTDYGKRSARSRSKLSKPSRWTCGSRLSRRFKCTFPTRTLCRQISRQYLSEAVDKVRRQEHKELMAEGDERLKGTRRLWLYNPKT